MPGDRARDGLRVLVVATKPPWPPLGGGSLTLHGLLVGLCGRSATVEVVSLGPSPAPSCDLPYEVHTTGSQPRAWASPANLGRLPWPLVMARYQLPELRAAVSGALDRFRPDVVHLEQLHTAWLLPWLRRRCPVVLREQNAEHRLVARVADVAGQPLRALLRFEARLVARAEGRSCALADTVAAISGSDADALRRVAPTAQIVVLPAAYPQARAAGKIHLTGSPPYLALGSFDWRANRVGALWLIREVWPRLRSLIPAAVLHVAGSGSRALPGSASDGIVFHGLVPDASALFDPRAIALVPVRAGSGVRLRLLAAWDELVPAVTTPLGGEGLVSRNNDGALLATTADEFAAAAAGLARDEALRRRIVDVGRQRIASHAPDRVATAAMEIYREAIARGRARGCGTQTLEDA